MGTELQIDIVSDVSCPWCIIGYKALDLSLNILKNEVSAHLSWKSFELNTAMALEGEDLSEHLHKKYGSSNEDLKKTIAMITERGDGLGFRFDFKGEGRIYNTFNAHRLIYWAKEFGKQTELKLALFELYFSEGGNPASAHDLRATVAKVGLNEREANQILASERYVKEVREEQAKYLAMEIRSVPTFIINNKYKITGGQSVEKFTETLRIIAAEEQLN